MLVPFVLSLYTIGLILDHAEVAISYLLIE